MKTMAMPKFLHLFMNLGANNQRNLILLVILLAILSSIGTQVLHFYWQIAETPSNPDSLDKATISKSDTQIKYEDFELIFGFSDQQATQNNNKDIPITRLNLTLRGVIANPDNKEHDSAIIQSANMDKLYLPGDTLPGGAILDKVYADHIIIKRGNQLEKLYFPDAAKDSRALQEFKPAIEEAASESQPDIRNYNSHYPDDMSLEERMQEIRERLQEAGQK